METQNELDLELEQDTEPETISCESCGDEIACTADCDETYEVYESLPHVGEPTPVFVCEHCRSEHFVRVYCPDGKWRYISEEMVTWAEDEPYYVDDERLTWCESCEQNYNSEMTSFYETGYGYSICECCVSYDSGWVLCEDIHQYMRDEDAHWDEYQEEWYADASNLSLDNLMSYSTNVLDVLGRHAHVEGRLVSDFACLPVMGVELETDSRHICSIPEALRHTELYDWAICKSDATCSGPEIVTLPADLYSHKYVRNWAHVMEVLRPIAKGYHGADNGIHIHINRSFLTPSQLGKVLVFCNSMDNQEFLEVIAQRPINGWCRTNPEKYRSVAQATMDPADGKYSVVNVTRHTCEFRMFKSTLLAERMFKNLEFVDAICHFAKQPSMNYREDYQLPGGFIRYVQRNSERYGHLSTFLETRWS